MKILVVQTAFLGDVILSTPIVERLASEQPKPEIHLLVRSGNEAVYANNPHVTKVWVWQKQESKYKNLFKIALQLKKLQFDWVFNCHRFASSGLLSWYVGAKVSGFKKNPVSFLFNFKIAHEYKENWHEVDRNLSLLTPLIEIGARVLPKIYPSDRDKESVRSLLVDDYCVIAPASVWFTKQYPIAKWVELIDASHFNQYYLIGGKADVALCKQVKSLTKKQNIEVLAGTLSILESAALMSKAAMCYTNDSGPTHLASAVGANTTSVFCSTIPNFGFGPLGVNTKVVETDLDLKCRPCGIHGKKACPEAHFNCTKIPLSKFID